MAVLAIAPGFFVVRFLDAVLDLFAAALAFCSTPATPGGVQTAFHSRRLDATRPTVGGLGEKVVDPASDMRR